MTMKLYEINEEIARLTDTVLVDEETGEIIGDITEICKQLEALQMEKKKILEYLAKVVLNTRADVEALKTEEKRLKERRDKLEKKAEKVLAIIDRECGEKTDLGVATLSYTTRPVVDVKDAKTAIYWLMLHGHTNCYRVKEPEVSRNDVKALIKAGTPVPGCTIITNRTSSLK